MSASEPAATPRAFLLRHAAFMPPFTPRRTPFHAAAAAADAFSFCDASARRRLYASAALTVRWSSAAAFRALPAFFARCASSASAMPPRRDERFSLFAKDAAFASYADWPFRFQLIFRFRHADITPIRFAAIFFVSLIRRIFDIFR